MTHLVPAFLTLSIALTLGACQATPGTDALPDPEPEVSTASAEPAPTPAPIEYGNFTSEKLNLVMVNELAG